jgi:hypothetical protein
MMMMMMMTTKVRKKMLDKPSKYAFGSCWSEKVPEQDVDEIEKLCLALDALTEISEANGFGFTTAINAIVDEADKGLDYQLIHLENEGWMPMDYNAQDVLVGSVDQQTKRDALANLAAAGILYRVADGDFDPRFIEQ